MTRVHQPGPKPSTSAPSGKGPIRPLAQPIVSDVLAHSGADGGSSNRPDIGLRAPTASLEPLDVISPLPPVSLRGRIPRAARIRQDRSLSALRINDANSSAATDAVEDKAAASIRSNRQVPKKRKGQRQADTLRAPASPTEQDASAEPTATNARQTAPSIEQQPNANKPYDFTLAEDALILALYDQACDASTQSPSSNIDSEPPAVNWTEIARDHFSHPNRSPKKLANSILPERLNHLKGRRLWLAERAKAYAELEESIAAARERLAAAGASAPEVGTNQQDTLPHGTVSPPPKPAIATAADPVETSTTTTLLSKRNIAIQPLNPSSIIDSCEEMIAIAARLKSSKKKKRSISTAEEE